MKKWPVSQEYVAGEPYALADGRIRIGWFKSGKLELLSFIEFEGAKVKDISTKPAVMPVKISN